MKNLKNINYSGSNVLVYVKTKDSTKFEALASLRTFDIAPNLMYAALYPFEKLEALKEYLSSMIDLCKKTETTFQVRTAKDRKTVLFQIN